MENNNDFKYVLQDTNHVYLGARFTYKDMMEWDDVPFKWKAIINKFLISKVRPESTIGEHLFVLTKDDFAYQIFKQLRMQIKAGHYENTIDRKGNSVKKYISKKYSLDDCMELKEEELVIEEIILSKLALLAFSI